MCEGGEWIVNMFNACLWRRKKKRRQIHRTSFHPSVYATLGEGTHPTFHQPPNTTPSCPNDQNYYRLFPRSEAQDVPCVDDCR